MYILKTQSLQVGKKKLKGKLENILGLKIQHAKT